MTSGNNPAEEPRERTDHGEQVGKGSFRVAFAWTTIPIVALSLIATAGAMVEFIYGL